MTDDERIGRHDYELAKVKQTFDELFGTPNPDEWPAKAAELRDIIDTLRTAADGGRTVPKVAICEDVAQEELEYRLKKGTGTAVTSDVVKREVDKRHGFEPNPKTVTDALERLADRLDHVAFQPGSPGRGGKNARAVVEK